MSFNEEYELARVRQKLQEDGVKLWTSPYYVDNALVEEKLKELAFSYSDVLAIPFNTVVSLLSTLQTHALEKLASRIQFQQTGLATLRIKLSGSNTSQKNIFLQLTESGESLKSKILSEMQLQSTPRLKLICNGIVLKDSSSLFEQKVSNNSQILVIILPNDPASQQMEEMIIKEVELIKADADLLANQKDENYLRIADQSGNIIDLPFEEKKSLAVAMALHEKGRSALKRNQVSLALMLFHEADSKFSSCRSELLKAVDNAALLNLDIAWCYLLLGNAADIPDAVIRLDQCEQSLYRSYGQHMERLLTLKGTTGNEAVLFVRLHLLQGIVAFHQGRTLDSVKLLNLAKEEMEKLKVDDNDLSKLVNLGYSISDARLGLRACRGGIDAAYLYLQRREQERAERVKREKEEEERNRQRKKLGKTANNQWVNLGYLNTIVEMGYDRERAVQGLKQTNNDISKTIELLQTDLEFFGNDASNLGFSEESLAQIVSMGFTIERAREMLEKHKGDIELAIEELTSVLGQSDEKPSTSSSSTEESTRMEKEAYKRLAKDIPKSEEDHLDTGLEVETEYLHKYLSFLSS